MHEDVKCLHVEMVCFFVLLSIFAFFGTLAKFGKSIRQMGYLKACWKHQSFAVWFGEALYRDCHSHVSFETSEQQFNDALYNGLFHAVQKKQINGRGGKQTWGDAYVHCFAFSVDHKLYSTFKNAGWMGPEGRHSHMCKSDQCNVRNYFFVLLFATWTEKQKY